MNRAFALADADVHAFVDGRLEADRRPDFLRRLAGSPADRARIEAWQGQNDMLRAAFATVAREPIPAALDLVPPAALRRVAEGPARVTAKAGLSQGRVASAVATVLVVAACVGGTLAITGRDDGETRVAGTPAAGASVGAVLAARADRALAADVRSRSDGAESLPTAAIPDLGAQGFTLTQADTDRAEPASLVLHYEDAAADRLVLSVARTRDGATTAPAKVGRGIGWRRHHEAYVLVGTLATGRLLEIARSLRDEPGAR